MPKNVFFRVDVSPPMVLCGLKAGKAHSIDNAHVGISELQFPDKFFRIKKGVCNCILKLKMHHRGSLVTTAPRMRRWCVSVRAPPPSSSAQIFPPRLSRCRRDEPGTRGDDRSRASWVYHGI